MSLEIILHPKSASRDDVVNLLKVLGYLPCEHLWNWPEGSRSFHWYQHEDFLSYDGVEATVYRPSTDAHGLGACEWALHTRTRASASPADKNYQDETIRVARATFGGNFYNDWCGKNRYTRRDADGRDPISRGIYLAYEAISSDVRALRFAIPPPLEQFEKLAETELASLAQTDPTRVLYNALVPFAVAALESFFCQCFKVILQHDKSAQEKVKKCNKKVEFVDVLSVKNDTLSVETIIANGYSFQNIDSIHKAFSEWCDINFWKVIRRKKRFGKKIAFLDSQLKYMIDFRHGIIHRMNIDRRLTYSQVNDILSATLIIMDVFVEHLEEKRAIPIRYPR